MALYYFDPEQLGRRRFPDNKSYRASLANEASLILSAMFDLLPSNYPKDTNSNLAILYRVLAREAARQQQSINYINDDKVYTNTRIEYLQQILGERLFLNQQLIPVTNNDIDYRNFLISIKDAYLKGSKKSVIEDLINRYTKLKVNIKELYLEARKPLSAYGLTDTHKMIVEVFVDELIAAGMDIATINNNLAFFVNTTKPAHVLYDTKLIWTETIIINKIHDLIFGDLGGGCVPKYIYTPFSEKTVLARSIMVVGPNTPPGPNIYVIGSIHPEDLIIYTTDDTKVYVEPGTDGTLLFGPTGRRILFSDLQIGQTIRMVSLVIPGDFNFYYLPPDLVEDYDSRFYKNIYRKPAFQEFVKKEMDSKGKFPLQIATTPTTMCDRWHHDVLQPMYEDMRKNCNEKDEQAHTYEFTLAQHMWSPRFPDDGMDSTNERPVVGDLYSFTLPYAPLTDGSSNQASPTDIGVLRDGTALSGAVEYVDASSAYVSLQDTASYWNTAGGPMAVTTSLQFQYNYLVDGTNYSTTTDYIFGINYWQLPGAPISNGQGTNVLAFPSDVQLSVDGTAIPDAIVALNAINGIVTVQDQASFWIASPLGRVPQIGDSVAFDYYQSGTKRYALLFDDPARTSDDDMVLDGPVTMEDPARVPIAPLQPLQIGYKFRADLLHHASVLNSFDTLLLNNYQKPAKRASIANRQDTLNHYNYFFSPEFLEDDDSPIILNDKYLDKDLPPAITLNYGTPPFQKTYASQPGMIRELKLQDIRENHRLLMYCDLLLKEYRSGDDSVQLSSICDNSPMNFSVRFEEELPPIEECDPWLLFDVAETQMETVQIPSTLIPSRNLRISGKDLREDFILREMAPTGTASTTYTYQEGIIPVTELYLPETVRTTITDGRQVDFPALPIMKDSTAYADASDVIVQVNGTVVTGLIKTFDPLLGYVELYSDTNLAIVDYIQLTQDDIDNRYARLSSFPLNGEAVALNVIHGPAQVYGVDFVVEGDVLFLEQPMRVLLSPGDILVVTYQTAALTGRELKFTYNIKTTGVISTLDFDRSRVIDSNYVLAGQCYDGFRQSVAIEEPEYVNFLSDYGKGIKFTYLNKDTYQLEEHVFSGPVFETYNACEDEISALESFPNALVRIKSPLTMPDPLKTLPNYDFLNSDAIRIRKKTLRELLPDRTYRSLQIIEAMSV
jgi:hypothetical protein